MWARSSVRAWSLRASPAQEQMFPKCAILAGVFEQFHTGANSLDVHKDSITAAVLPAAGEASRQPDRIPNEPRRVRRYFSALARDAELRVCYEASSVGFVLQRQLHELGIGGAVVAPSLIPKRPGDKRKTDRRDARGLARLFRAGELVEVRIPTEVEEQSVKSDFGRNEKAVAKRLWDEACRHRSL
jgi:transposase